MTAPTNALGSGDRPRVGRARRPLSPPASSIRSSSPQEPPDDRRPARPHRAQTAAVVGARPTTTAEIADVHLRELFADDPGRGETHDARGRRPLPRLLQEPRSPPRRCRLLVALARAGRRRAARATPCSRARRSTSPRTGPCCTSPCARRATQVIVVDGDDVVPEVHEVLDRMADLRRRVRSGEWVGHTGKRIRNVVNIGIGGSDLGPHMAYEALRDLQPTATSRCASSRTSTAPTSARPPATSIPPRRCSSSSSKTFTTLETMTNAHSARRLGARRRSATTPRWPSTSSRCRPTPRRSTEFGIDTANMFGFWDWVGGRYSLRLRHRPVADDRHRARPVRRDARRLPPRRRALPHRARSSRTCPMLLGLIGVWYNNFFGAQTLAVLPYSHYLGHAHGLPPAARHGEQRQVGRPRGRPGRRADRPDRVGPARHQRPARLLPADPPGHEADPVRLHRLLPARPRGRRPPGPAHGELLRPARGAGVRQDRATRCAAEGVPEHAGAAPHLRRQPPDARRSSCPS